MSSAVPDLPSDEGETRRGLFYPLGRWHPAPGALHEIADGVQWLRMPLNFSLDHINLWVLDGGSHWVIVDTGFPGSEAKEAWRHILGGPLASKPVGAVLCTHYHPDHLGLAGWLIKKTGARLVMTRTEYLMARMLQADRRDSPPAEAISFSAAAGWPEERLEKMRGEGWGRFAQVTYELPAGFERIKDGDVLTIGARKWRIVTGSGHTPEHACLVDDEGELMISGDQVLPRITSNVSLFPTEPAADPLGDWLASIEKLRGLSAELFVLPAHGFPFRGLHARLDQLEKDHQAKLGMLTQFLDRPRLAVETFDVLFGRPIGENEYGMATGEALAHLRYLEARGRARRERKGTRDYWQV